MNWRYALSSLQAFLLLQLQLGDLRFLPALVANTGYQ